MQERRRFRRIESNLDGIVQIQRTNEAMECVIRNINEECTGIMIATSDPRVCAREDVKVSIFIPSERSPVKCAGRITWYSEDKEPFMLGIGYLAGIFITDISRLDLRRLELVLTRRDMLLNSRLNRATT